MVEIVHSAQLAQAFATYERSFFLSSPDDQRKIAERLGEMAAAATKLSRSLREQTSDLPWDALIAAGEEARSEHPDPAALWNAVKKVVPPITSRLAPLLGEAASVFAWTPPPKTRRAKPKQKKKRR